MDSHDDDDEPQLTRKHQLVCDGCGLPPNDGAVLKRCTRCQQAHYHNATCQRQHYPHHKATCRRVSTTTRSLQHRNSRAGGAAATEERSSSCSSAMVRVEERPHRGKCLIAARDIEAHQVILPLSSSSSSSSSSSTPTNARTFAPLVPPVLFAEQRQTHCAVCFQKLRTTTTARSSSNIVLCQEPRYYVAVCSAQCQIAGQDWLPVEIQAIASSLHLYFAKRPSVRILPSAVLIYRILLAVAGSNDGNNKSNNDPKQSPNNNCWTPIHWHNDVLAMQAHAPTDPAAATHAQATFILVSTWLDETSATLLPRVVQICGSGLKTIVSQVLQRLMCNAFTLTASTDPADTTSLGFGLYRFPAHCINHSCCPNAVQSFVVGTVGQTPGLQLHAGVRPIDAQEEICIVYVPLTNNTTEERRAELQSTYHFICQCPRCGPGEE